MSLKVTALAALFLTATMAKAAEPINLGPSGKAEVEMTQGENGYVIAIRLPSGKSQKIEDEFVPFEMDGAPAAIAITDFDRDGVEEFVVRTMIPPQSGALYIYQYNAKSKKFIPMVTGKEADDDYLNVDAVAPVRVDRDGTVIARIALRTEQGEKSEDRTYKLVKGKFKRVK